MASTDTQQPQADTTGAQDSQNARSRWRVSARETNVLEAVFSQSPRPNKNTIVQLATMLGVKPRQVQVWFQNRRQRWRKDFLELERARSQQMAELSGKVIDFHGDLLPPLPAGADGAAVAMPAGWEGLLLQPGVATAEATPTVHAAQVVASPSPQAPAAAAAPPAAKAAPEASPVKAAEVKVESTVVPVVSDPESVCVDHDEIKSHIDNLDELDIADLLNLPAAEGKATTGVPASDSSPIALARSATDLSLNCSPPKSPDQDSEDTIWLGMEWLIADSDELMNQPIAA